MRETPDILAAKLRSEGERIRAYFASLGDTQWHTEIYDEGAVWTPRSILAHLMTSERGFLKLFENVRTGGGGSSADFSIDRHNARQQESTRDLLPSELLRQYAEVRSEMVGYVAQLSHADLEARGRHPALGDTTLLDMIKMLFLHNSLHVRDIKRVLSDGPHKD